MIIFTKNGLQNNKKFSLYGNKYVNFHAGYYLIYIIRYRLAAE